LNPEFKKTALIYVNLSSGEKQKIIDAKSPFHNKTVDILVVDGFIKKIAVSPKFR
jgi:hypothetical protein